MTAARSTRLEGVTSVVTGGGRGLGRLVAQTLAGAGARVGIIARTSSELEATVAMIHQDGGVAVAATADITDDAPTASAFDTIRRAIGPIDVLVNDAAINGPVGAFPDIDLREWWQTIEVNLGGAVRCARVVLPEMRSRQHGRIINITSVAGAFRWPTVSAYAVSKGALIKFTENLAVEVRRYGISVFSFHPGLLPLGLAQAGMNAPASPDSPAAHIAAWARQQQAAGRFNDPQRAADYICALASGHGDSLSGRHLTVDDDLDELLDMLDDVLRFDLHTLRVRSGP